MARSRGPGATRRTPETEPGTPYNGGATEPGYERESNRGLVWALVAIIVGLLIWAVWATWFEDEGSQVSGPDIGATVPEVASNPSEFAGSRVVLSSQIDQVIAGGETGAGVDGGGALTGATEAGAFTIGQGDASLLVVGSNIPGISQLQENQDLAQGDVVQVTGTVRLYDAGIVEDELGGAFDQEAFGAFNDNQGMIVADTLRLVPQASQAGESVQVTTSALVDNPQEFYGERVTIGNATIGNQIGGDGADGGAFEFQDETSLLILAPGATAQGLGTGEAGTLTGTVVEPSSVALIREMGLAQETDLFDEFGFGQDFDITNYEAVLVLRAPIGTGGGTGG